MNLFEYIYRKMLLSSIIFSCAISRFSSNDTFFPVVNTPTEGCDPTCAVFLLFTDLYSNNQPTKLS